MAFSPNPTRKDLILVGSAIAFCVIDWADTVESLDSCLCENRAVIDWIEQHAPDLWERLKTRTQQRRAALAIEDARRAKAR